MDQTLQQIVRTSLGIDTLEPQGGPRSRLPGWPASGRREPAMSGYSSGEFTIDEVGFIQTALTKVLAAVARGEIDLNRIAREELASRGMDERGRWVGFDQAREALASQAALRLAA